VALIRGGVLMAAQDLPWGFLDEYGNGSEPRRREDIAARLGDDLADLFAVYEDAGHVGQLCICGGLPDLRSATLPLMARFDVEVETLDSLFRIDAASLPEPPDEFRERASELRLAWAAAADWTTINLLRAQRRRRSNAVLSRAAVVAGVVVGFGGAWSVVQSEPQKASVPAQLTHTALQGIKEDPAPIKQEPTLMIRQEPALIARITPRDALPPPVIRSEPPQIRQEPTVVRQGQVARAAAANGARPRVEEQALPLEAVLTGILFSSDRQLAIIDGRVVGRGDDVRGAIVVDVSATAVLLRDAQGRLRRLSSSGSVR
jgi:hypothetical protein